MDPVLVGRVALPALLVAFFLILMVWPVIRLRRETGTWAVTLHRRETPGQRLAALAFVVVQVGLIGLTVAYSAGGPARVGAWAAPTVVVWVGIAVSLAGLAAVAVAQRQMGASFRIGVDERPTSLIVGGLFGWVRNPIFSGLLITFAGVVLVAPCIWSIALWLAAAATVSYQIRIEERHLLDLHGDAYRRYAARTGRLLPGIGLLRDRAVANGAR